MEIRSESRIAHPREVVFRAYRDELPKMVRYLPDIREIVELSRSDLGGGVTRIHNEWASAKEIPAAARAVLRPEHLRWDDHAEWHENGHYVSFTINTRAFTDAVRCSGRNTFVEDGAGTRVLLTGSFAIDLREIPGVPGFLAKRVGPQLEKFIVGLITPNLEETNRAIQRYLDAEGRA